MKRKELVTKIMSTNPVTVHTGNKLSEARALMAEHKCHHLPVVSGKKLIGILSGTDLLRVSYEYGQSNKAADTVLDHTRSIEDVMQKGPVTISPAGTVREAAEAFSQNWFHALPVVEGDELVGIVTSSDVIQYLLAQY
jgi:CBS domain-containing protein